MTREQQLEKAHQNAMKDCNRLLEYFNKHRTEKNYERYRYLKNLIEQEQKDRGRIESISYHRKHQYLIK